MTANNARVSAARRGRRPGTSTTRQAILDAARVRFADRRLRHDDDQAGRGRRRSGRRTGDAVLRVEK